MNCPVCNVELKMGDRHGVEIDYCPQCRGVWLEKGKLDRILERAAGSSRPDPYANSFRENDHHDSHAYERGEHGHRKKSFLSNLFD
jgi:uncharacterized protein